MDYILINCFIAKLMNILLRILNDVAVDKIFLFVAPHKCGMFSENGKTEAPPIFKDQKKPCVMR